MKKRGQVSIFILIAVVIVAVIAIILYMNYSSQKQELRLDEFKKRGLEPSVKNIQSFIIDCLEENSRKALETIGIQGGYYNKPEKYHDLDWAFIPYYYDKGEFLMPTRETIQNELSAYVDFSINSCIDKIQFQALELTYQNPKTQTKIQKSKVTIRADLPITINSKGKTTLFELKEHELTINSSLNEMLEVADYITNSHKEDPEFMCINCITSMARERNIYVDFIAFDPDSTLIMLIENSTSPEPYIFEFMNRYVVETKPIKL